ncbi:MAG: hypothetical protein OXE40_10900 [Gammaproteobacteria bacterium]|nr:hypothetical protein [Gammaproteobacteria bacterium]
MYVALQDMASRAAGRRDEGRVRAIRWDIDGLHRHITSQLTELASVYGSIDELAARAGLPRPVVAVAVEPRSSPADMGTEQSLPTREDVSRPPLHGTLPESAEGRQRELVSRIVAQVDSRNRPYPAPQAWVNFPWASLYRGIKTRYAADVARGNIYATAASAAALRQIDQAVMDGYRSLRVRPARGEGATSPKAAMFKLRAMRSNAWRGSHSRTVAIRETLEGIYRLTREKQSDLALRHREFAVASSRGGAAVPDRKVLEAWLLQQAGAAGASSIEHRYFTQLANNVDGETDPWSVSRWLVGSLSAGVADQAERLQAAHRALVQAMAGTLLSSSPRPGSLATATPVPDGSRASASRQQPILSRLFQGERLSNDQCQAILAAVSRAAAAGQFPESTSRPETWAAGLLQRIQKNTDKPWAALTDIERAAAAGDWTLLRDLIQALETAGYL